MLRMTTHHIQEHTIGSHSDSKICLAFADTWMLVNTVRMPITNHVHRTLCNSSSTGSRNASVLPDPVLAAPTRSCPASRGGIACAYT
jgi:hypothetical protein